MNEPDLNQEKREEIIREYKQALKDANEEPAWVGQYQAFIQTLVNGHLPECRKNTGHHCDCWHKQIPFLGDK